MGGADVGCLVSNEPATTKSVSRANAVDLRKLCCLLQEQSSISRANLVTQYLPVVHQSELKESDHGFVVLISGAKREMMLRISVGHGQVGHVEFELIIQTKLAEGGVSEERVSESH